MIHNEIKEKVKEAMLAKEQTRLVVLRNILSAFMNELVAKKRKPQEELSDDDAMAVIRRLTKQRKDSIEQFTKGGRMDLVESEQSELKVLEAFLPQMMSKDDIRKIAEAKKAELGITDKSKSGMLMSGIMKDLKGKADGNDVKEVVESLFG
ncbi:MAG: GatB/YqeY domain-containing protein [Minisyncoccia bacterium]